MYMELTQWQSWSRSECFFIEDKRHPLAFVWWQTFLPNSWCEWFWATAKCTNCSLFMSCTQVTYEFLYVGSSFNQPALLQASITLFCQSRPFHVVVALCYVQVYVQKIRFVCLPQQYLNWIYKVQQPFKRFNGFAGPHQINSGNFRFLENSRIFSKEKSYVREDISRNYSYKENTIVP